mgnify:CR=1 FL=1
MGAKRDRGRVCRRPAGHQQRVVQHLADVIGVPDRPGIMADGNRCGIAQGPDRAEARDVFADQIIGLERPRTDRLIEELDARAEDVRDGFVDRAAVGGAEHVSPAAAEERPPSQRWSCCMGTSSR